MSQTTPPPHGQIDAPNPLELFWEKNKRIVLFGAFAAGVAILLNYGWQYMKRRELAQHWSQFAEASALDKGYAENASSWEMYKQFLIPRNPGYLVQYIEGAREDLVRKLPDDLAHADTPALERLAEGKDARAPLARWLLANQAIANAQWDEAEQHLHRLQTDFPEHFLCVESPFPVQYREPVEHKDENGKVIEPDKNRPPELEPAQAGSAVGRMLAAVAAERSFRQEHPALYQPTEPESAETVTIQFKDYGAVKIRLFTSRSPKTTEKFLQLAKDGWWKGQRVYQIQRPAEGAPPQMADAGEMHFGWPSTTNDDTSTWKAADPDPDHLVVWEDNDLSNFPGTVAVEPAKEGKSDVERIVITSADEARQDGSRVIIGRVVEGLDVVKEIVNTNFADEQSAQSGRGRPDENITIESVTVEQ